MGYMPKHGAGFNPLLKYPRNNACFCGSGRKFKSGCLPALPKCVPEKDLARCQELIKIARGKKSA